MPKTRRTKRNTSPGRPYRNSKAYVVAQGEMVATTGFRGRTQVVRVTDEAGKRVSIRMVPEAPQTVAKTGKVRGVFVGRQYTGVARSKSYPYRSVKRGGEALTADGLLTRTVKAVKKVVVREAAE